MNWGNKLVLVFVAFIALIGTLVYKAIHTQYDLYRKRITRMNLSMKIILQQLKTQLNLAI